MVNFEKYLVFFLFLMLVSCQQQELPPQNMVLEGWIEEGKEPMVLLHYTYALDERNKMPDTATIEDIIPNQVIMMAKVIISDGEEEVVLTSAVNSEYLPPSIYTTTHIVGEAGKTYTISASRNGQEVHATTSIPSASVIVKQIVVKTERDSMVSVLARIVAPEIGTASNIVLFLRKDGESHFVSCPVGCVNIEPGQQLDVPIYSSEYGGFGVSHFYSTDTTHYYLHVATVDDTSYQIWEGINAQTINQGMFFMGIYHNMPSNVSSNRGYWCGYNTQEYPFSTTRDTTFILL